MARTPLFGLVRRALLEAHATNQANLSARETSRGQRCTAGTLTNFTGGLHGVEVGAGSAAARAAEAVDDLDRIFLGIAVARRGTREVRMHWPSSPWTRGSYASYATGQWTAFRGVQGERVGRVYFAGQHCSLPAQGFMEGGCETGERAARGILAVRGLRTGQPPSASGPVAAGEPWSRRPRACGATGGAGLTEYQEARDVGSPRPGQGIRLAPGVRIHSKGGIIHVDRRSGTPGVAAFLRRIE